MAPLLPRVVSYCPLLVLSLPPGCLPHLRTRNALRLLSLGASDITGEPTERPYGIDFGIRDALGNRTRIGQMHLRG